MGDFSVVFKESINGIPFFTKKSEVRKILGKPEYNSIEERKMTGETKRAMDLMETAIKEVYTRMGKDPSTFEWPDISKYITDYDSYGKYQLEYDEEERLVSATLIAEYSEGFTICGKWCPDFNLDTLLSVADDFVVEEDGAAFVSNSLEMAIWCPDMDGRVESIVFACEGYNEDLDETLKRMREDDKNHKSNK